MARLQYCIPRGISPSSFGSGEAPVWTEEDAALALAWQRREAQACSSCGTRPEEWAQDRFAYVAFTRACAGCEVIAQERSQIRETDREYVHIGLMPRELVDDGT